MKFDWLKPYMPRGLYGRTTLILLLPVISIMLVVSVVFIQRHFEGVTKQMTLTASREVRLLLQNGDPDAAIDKTRMAETLQIALARIPRDQAPTTDERDWYDFTGRFVTREFRLLLPELAAISLFEDGLVHLYFSEGEDHVRMTFDRRRVSASNPHQLLVNMVVFAMIMTVIAYFYLRNQLRPITRLAAAAEAFGRGRHMEYWPAGAVEVRAAGRAFVDMRARIERQIEQRTLMLSGVSHDLRTPLTRMKLALSMLDAPETDRKAMAQDVRDMEQLITEFLDFARSAQEGEPELTDVVALCRTIVEEFQRMGKDVHLRSVEGEGHVILRPVAVKRAVENLIGNAVRYGRRAEMSIHLTPRSARIRVEDDGPGIPAAQRDQAIKPFARLDEARNQNLGSGVGLGLSIALDIARAHGGTLRLAESARLGGLQADIVLGR
ncbi:MAG: ATP-binding protein [Pseudomonadota bacterium]